MFETADKEQTDDFLDLDKVRQGWAETFAEPSETNSTPRPVEHILVQWDLEIKGRFEKVRTGLRQDFPDYIETFDVLLGALETDLKAWLGESTEVEKELTEDSESEATLDLMPAALDPVEAGEAFEKGLMELENFLEAIFVDGDFWRLMR